MRKWPISGVYPVDRAREVARTCWVALAAVDPDAAEAIAQAARMAGEAWLAPQVAQYGLDDTVTVPEAAELVGRSVRWVYQWVAIDLEHRRVHASGNRIRVRVRDLLESEAHKRAGGNCGP